jgi:hypothetical protein
MHTVTTRRTDVNSAPGACILKDRAKAQAWSAVHRAGMPGSCLSGARWLSKRGILAVDLHRNRLARYSVHRACEGRGLQLENF